jgi:hypothetical protein
MLAQHRLGHLHIEAARDAFVAVQRRHVGEREVPEDAPDGAARVASDRRIAFARDHEPVPRQAGDPDRSRRRAALGHRGDVHVRAVGEIEGHRFRSPSSRAKRSDDPGTSFR